MIWGLALVPWSLSLYPRRLSLKLIAEFSEDEIKQAVWQCEGSKSPGPDEFNFNFIKSNWNF